MTEYVVLVNEQNQPIGKADKATVHNNTTRLHRGFSIFLFNPKGKLLLQQRSHKKKTFPLVWSNSCCGHPAPDESDIDAAKRRVKFELGISNIEIHMIDPHYRYRVGMNEIYENEFCPIMIGFIKEEPKINEDEVESIKWLSWDEWVKEITEHPEHYSLWSVEETKVLNNSEKFQELLKRYF